MVALLIVAGAVCFWGFKSGDSRSFQIAKNLDIFNSIVKELDMFYVDTIDPNKTIREGIDAMLYSLDPYTEYYPEDDQSELEQMLKNSYGGIGSVITWNPKLKRSMISEPYENMPAADVGLKAGPCRKEQPRSQRDASRTSGYQLQAESATSRYRETVGFRHCAPFHPIAVHTLLYGAG